MNHAKKNLTNRLRKKVVKVIRKDQKETADSQENLPQIRNLRGQNLAKRPSKVVKQEQSRVAAVKKSILIKKVKKLVKHAKRTTPGEVEGKVSSPKSSRQEGTRWLKVTEKQTLQRASRLRRRLTKK